MGPDMKPDRLGTSETTADFGVNTEPVNISGNQRYQAEMVDEEMVREND